MPLRLGRRLPESTAVWSVPSLQAVAFLVLEIRRVRIQSISNAGQLLQVSRRSRSAPGAGASLELLVDDRMRRSAQLSGRGALGHSASTTPKRLSAGRRRDRILAASAKLIAAHR